MSDSKNKQKLYFFIFFFIISLFSWGSACARVCLPDYINGLAMWFDASDIDGDGQSEGVLEDGLAGSRVSQWSNKGNLGGICDAAAPPGFEPEWISADISGRDAISFGGDFDPMYFQIDQEAVNHTIFIVAENADNLRDYDRYGTLIVLNAGSHIDANKRQPLIFQDDRSDRISLSYTGSNGIQDAGTFGNFVSAQWNIKSVLRDTNSARMFLNSDQVNTLNVSQESEDGSDYIGWGGQVSDNHYFHGKIAEIIFYNRVLSDEEHNLIGYYLSQKYGFATGFAAAPIPAGFINQSEGTTIVSEAGQTSDNFTVRLNFQPTDDVYLRVYSNNGVDDIRFSVLGDTSQQQKQEVDLLFTRLNWDQPQTVKVTAINDNIYEGDETADISFDITSVDPGFDSSDSYVPGIEIEIDDNDFSTEYIDHVYLHIDPCERDRIRLAEQLGLYSISPVVLPENENLVGINNFFGWPVAAMINDTIIVKSVRYNYHYGGVGDKTDQYSGRFIVRSDDAGFTWQPILWIEPLFAAGGQGISGMLTIGVTNDSEFIIKHKGLLRSYDEGLSWYLNGGVFAGLSTDNTNGGPDFINHPVFGLMHFSGKLDDAPYFTWIRRSVDGGYSWEEVSWNDSATNTDPKEPAAVTWGPGHILLLSREFNESFADNGKTYAMSQHLYRYNEGDSFNEICFETKRTNIEGNLAAGRWANDTADLCFNPVTNRIEVIHSHRHGGGPGYDGNNTLVHMSSLLIWSIDPQELLEGSADWRFEGTLLLRNDRQDHFEGIDGCHPGGAVIDTKRNVQHIFIYAGAGTGGEQGIDNPNGIFHIKRTLDTPRLSRFLKATIPNHEKKGLIRLEHPWLSEPIGKAAVLLKWQSSDLDFSTFNPLANDISFTDNQGYITPHSIMEWDFAGGAAAAFVQFRNLDNLNDFTLGQMRWGDPNAHFHQTQDNLDPGKQSFTVSFWVRNHDSHQSYMILNKGNDSSNIEPGWSFSRTELAQNANLIFRVSGGSYVYVPSFRDTSTAHHIAGVIDRTSEQMRIYMDGMIMDSRSVSAVPAVKSDEQIRLCSDSAAALSNVILTDQVLTESQIQNIYKEGPVENYVTVSDSMPADLDNDYDMTLDDFVLFTQWWGKNCSSPFWCDQADLNRDETVDIYDLKLLCADWLWKSQIE